METTYINILLTTCGLVGSLAAFGGKTWIEGNAPITQRLTKRGYLSLLCLLSAFTLGIYKEINNNKIIDNKDDKISKLQDELYKVQIQLSTYKEVLMNIKAESHRQEQVVMAQFVKVQREWNAPNFLYPGSVVKFYQTGGNNLIIRYGNRQSGFKEDRININAVNGGTPYEIPIVGNSGEEFTWSLIGNWEGKVYVYSSPRQREQNWSWEEESSIRNAN